MPNRSKISRSYQSAARHTLIDRIDLRVRPAHTAFYAHAADRLNRVQMVDNFKPRLGRMPVDGGDRAQPYKFFAVFEVAAQVHDLRGIGDQSGFAQRQLGFENRRMR